MRNAITVLAILALLAFLPTTASAQDGAKRGGKKREAILKKFDQNGDGKLDKEERAAARASRESKKKLGLRARVLKRFDKNGDGTLDQAERAALKKFRDAHRGKPGKRRLKLTLDGSRLALCQPVMSQWSQFSIASFRPLHGHL